MCKAAPLQALPGEAYLMERQNSKLYLENCYIMQQNERLRRAIGMLTEENQALQNELNRRNMIPATGNGGPSSFNSTRLPDLNGPPCGPTRDPGSSKL